MRSKLKIKILESIIRGIYRDLTLQEICFNHKDIKEAKEINYEITKWLEELQLHK